MRSGCGALLRGREEETSKAPVRWRAIFVVRAVSVMVAEERDREQFGFEVGEWQVGKGAS